MVLVATIVIMSGVVVEVKMGSVEVACGEIIESAASAVDVATIGATAADAVSIIAGAPVFCVAPQVPVEILITSFST